MQILVAGFLGLFLLSIVTVGVTAAGGFAAWSYATEDLPTEGQDVEALQFQTTKIYDRNWQLLHEVSDPQTGWRTAVGYQEIVDNIEANKDREGAPQKPWIFDATVAAEDATFWTNSGVDPAAIVRGLMINFSGSGSSGASTITQQLVRALYPESIGYERSYTRKLREAVTAYEFNKLYTKEQILEMYLNNVYYGNRAYGIDAAAQTYFSKHPWDLTLGEASLLAGLPQAPSYYEPTQNYELARARQQYVLDQMVRNEMITEAQAHEAYAEPLNPQSRDGRYNLTPHFVNYVMYYLEQRYGADVLYRGGLSVRTTLDVETQETAQRIVRDHVDRLAPYDVNNGSLVAMLPWSGEIIAMVGSADYYNNAIDGQVNVAVRERQPGSSIKPITYLAAFEAGWHPGTMVFDYGKRWETPGAPDPYYEPRNATRQFYGAISVREALGNSLNITAVQALEHIGVPSMIDLAHRMGIRTGLWRGDSFYGLAITLGGGEVTLLEHTNVFGTMANNGRYVPYTPIMEIIDGDGQKVFELDRENAFESGTQVVQAEHAYQITDILSDDDARSMIFGPNSPLTLPELDNRPVAAKTGTTEDSRDGWTMGYTTDLVVGVWVGNTDNRPTQNLDGVAGAAPIWHEFMVEVHQNEVLAQVLLGSNGEPIPEKFPMPPGIKEGPVCVATGKRPLGGSSGGQTGRSGGGQTRTEVLVDGGPPTMRCDQMSEEEREDLEAALEDMRTNSAMTSRGRETLAAYARAVGIRGFEIKTPARPTPNVDPTPDANPSVQPTPEQEQPAPQPTPVPEEPAPQPTPMPEEPAPQPTPVPQPTPQPTQPPAPAEPEPTEPEG